MVFFDSWVTDSHTFTTPISDVPAAGGNIVGAAARKNPEPVHSRSPG